FNNITTVRMNLTYDPYERDPITGRRINKLLINTQDKLLRLDNWNAGVTTDLTVGRVRDLIRGQNTDQRLAEEAGKPQLQEQDLLTVLENFRINHSFTVSKRFDASLQKDTVVISANSISSSG